MSINISACGEILSVCSELCIFLLAAAEFCNLILILILASGIIQNETPGRFLDVEKL